MTRELAPGTNQPRVVDLPRSHAGFSKHDVGYTIQPARYAGRWNGKPQLAVKCWPSGDGYKTRAMRLIGDGLNGRYSRRESAYIVSPTKAAKFESLYAAGYDASAITGAPQPPSKDWNP